MAGKGPPPKTNAVRRNTDPFTHDLSGPQAGRELPRALGVRTAAAKRFWKTWAESPQAAHFLETDWAELEITTKLVDEFYTSDPKLAGEIRQRVSKWGATVEDRARLRMNFEEPPAQTEEVSEAPTENIADMELFRRLSGG
ncbi:phage terminase small subunit [Streptomyces decoyicus]